jgi:hypothetical protein
VDGPLLVSHSDHGYVATICTVSRAVASQHPNCGAATPVGHFRCCFDSRQAVVTYCTKTLGDRRTTSAILHGTPRSLLLISLVNANAES